MKKNGSSFQLVDRTVNRSYIIYVKIHITAQPLTAVYSLLFLLFCPEITAIIVSLLRKPQMR